MRREQSSQRPKESFWGFNRIKRGSVVLCPLEVEMPVKEKKRQRIYDAIAGPINRARVDVRMATRPGMSLTDVDKLLRDLTEQIWTKVKIEAGLRD